MVAPELEPKEKHSKMKNKKRKLKKSLQKSERPSKSPRRIITQEGDSMGESEQVVEQELRDLSQGSEEGNPWKNLELVFLIQDKKLDHQKKVEAVFSFFNSNLKERDQYYGPVKRSRLVVFLSDWVQSLLISSEKKVKDDSGKSLKRFMEPCLDYRFWEIFKFCLEESVKFHITLNISKNLLNAFYIVTRNAISLLAASLSSKEQLFTGSCFKLYNFVLDCVSLVFSSHLGLSNESLDSWITTIETVLEFVHDIYVHKLDSGDVGIFAIKFSCVLLEPFAKFLWVHPTKKNGFDKFVNQLLEPVLRLLGDLSHDQTDGYNDGGTKILKNLLEEVLSHALFHTVHIDGFLCLNASRKFVKSQNETLEDSKALIKSYHRHLFKKLQKLVAGKKFLALGAIGELLQLLVVRVKKVKGVSLLFEETKMNLKTGSLGSLRGNIPDHASYALQGSTISLSEESKYQSSLSTELRKSLFEFFVQVLEPLLDIIGCIGAKSKLGPALSDTHFLLKSVNNLLASFMREKVYVRTEDSSEGAYLNFLKEVYDTIMLVSSKLLLLSRHEIENSIEPEVLFLVANEILMAVNYLLEIEYDVIGNDLVNLWLVILSYSAINLSFTNIPGQHLLASKIQELGCQLVVIYGQLRQVDISIFALCKAMRTVISNEDETEKSYARFMTSLGYEAYGKSVGMLLSSQEFKFAIHKVIKFVPEGQAGGIIRQLAEDVSETTGWLKRCNLNLNRSKSISCFNLRTELLGRGLSEMYALILDSLIITSGNAFQIGTSIENLIATIRPCMSILVGLQSDGAKAFLIAVMGKSFDDIVANEENGLDPGMTSYWAFVYFFRLYMSCRSLYRQAISLMPPASSRKMSATIGDSFVAYSAYDWMQRTDWSGEGYFSWILQPSVFVLDVAESVSSLYQQGDDIDWWPLIYVLLTMALQRLVDLNKKIKSLEYLNQRNENLMMVGVLDDDGLLVCQKKSKKLGKLVSVLRNEAADLTDFMMGQLSLVAKGQMLNLTPKYASSNDKTIEKLHDMSDWDFSICNLNKRSLPTAIWWIVCQNVDIWSLHAAKKKLKMFLSFLIRTTYMVSASTDLKIGTQKTNGSELLKKVSVQQISAAVLSDTTFYEQRFVCRYMPSRLCFELKDSIFSSFQDKSLHDININSTDWTEVITALQNTIGGGVCSGKHSSNDNSSLAIEVTCSSDILRIENCQLKEDSHLSNVSSRACEHLINLLCWMPKGNISSRSLALYSTYVLDLERLLVNALLDNQSTLCSPNQFELLKLFLSCRKALKYLFMGSFEAGGRKSSFISILSQDQLPVSWLFKSVSVVIELQGASSENSDCQVKDTIFSLMDHTLYLILTTSKYQFKNALHPVVTDSKPCKEQYPTKVSLEQSNGVDLYLDPTFCVEACNSAFGVATRLKELADTELISLKKSNVAVGDGDNVANMYKIHCLASCLNGFLWGLASVVDLTDLRNDNRHTRSMKLNYEHSCQVNLCINTFSELIIIFLEMFLDRCNQQLIKLCDYQNLRDLLGGTEADTSFSKHHELESSHSEGGCENISSSRKKLHLENKSSVATILNEANLIEIQSLNKSFLKGLLNGSYPEVAVALKQLYIAASVILRLHMQYDTTSLSSNLLAILIGISRVLLLELVDKVELPQPFLLSWLDGVLKYLEELGHLFPFADPVQSRNLYSKLIDLHLKVLGKCISLQGKQATLASHETESTTKTLDGHLGSVKASSSPEISCIDEFKARLRMSFKVFIRKASELHLLSVIQAIERALVGVQEGCTVIYELCTGSEDGGSSSSIVAAGVECLDLVLEFVSGRKCLGVVKRHIQSLIAGLFNIVLHLQSPLIFYAKMMDMKDKTGPDPGAVILMCVEVLTRVSGKHALFQMNAGHIAQCLRIPAALFEDFSQLNLSGIPIQSENSFISAKQVSEIGVTTSDTVIDRQFVIDLFASCCKLLYTVLKHHKSESKRCISQLEASVSVLLHSLERVDPDPECTSGYFSWEVKEAVKCACFLRRIYEEIRQQKDIIGRHSSLFLSNYIWVYSGYGPLKSGIKREINEALKPGIYALIDACSAEDLQYLHTVFGEGPCRNTLATLQQDYKQFFQYEGKV